MINLDNAGLTLEEAWQIIKADITIRRMLIYQVESRVHTKITPQDVRKEYERYLQDCKEQEEYVWSAISLRGSSQEQVVAIGEAAYELLTKEKLPPEGTQESLKESLRNHHLWDETLSISLSPVYSQKRRELSDSLIELFSSMQEGTYSLPLFQPSRSDRTPIVRLYYLQQLPKESSYAIHEIEAQLRAQIAQQMIEQETFEYFARLRRHFHVSKDQIEAELPPTFEPFELR
jgi:hypothetical protein